MHPVILQPEAQTDVRTALEWYEQKSQGLGKEFLRCMDAVVCHISRSPKLFPEVYKNVRRALIRRFPFSVFYILAEEQIIVLAVLHVRKDPQRWPEHN